MTSTLSKYTSLWPRLIAALAGGLTILFATLWNQWGYFAIFLFISIMSQYEFYRLARLDDKFPLKTWGTIIGQLFFVLSFLVEADIIHLKYFLLIFPMLASVFLIQLYKRNGEKPFTHVAFTYLGVIYVAIPFALLNIIAFSSGEYSYEPVLGILFILWASDTGAYFAGITFGKKKLFERISPKKTWEGSIGGGIAAMILAFAVGHYFQSVPQWQWYVIAGIIVIAGTYGDLVESLFKRSIEIKDSGTFIPGHGGFLDRFDGLLLATPFIVAFIKIF